MLVEQMHESRNTPVCGCASLRGGVGQMLRGGPSVASSTINSMLPSYLYQI